MLDAQASRDGGECQLAERLMIDALRLLDRTEGSLEARARLASAIEALPDSRGRGGDGPHDGSDGERQ